MTIFRSSECVVPRCVRPTLRTHRKLFVMYVVRNDGTLLYEYHHGAICAHHGHAIFGDRDLEECLWSYAELRKWAREYEKKTAHWNHADDEDPEDLMVFMKNQKVPRIELENRNTNTLNNYREMRAMDK